MHIHIFTLKFDSVFEAFDDSNMQDFLKDKELLSARAHFFVKHETPYLLVFLTYLPGSKTFDTAGKKQRDAWREILSEDDLPLFNTLRDWRAERAKAEGIPPYIICTNLQLAQIVSHHPASLSALGTIEGIGKAKLEKYGKELLSLLKPPKLDDSEVGRQQQMFQEQEGEKPSQGKELEDEPSED